MFVVILSETCILLQSRREVIINHPITKKKINKLEQQTNNNQSNGILIDDGQELVDNLKKSTYLISFR